MYKFACSLSLIALALFIPARTVAAEGNRSMLFQVGGGLYSPSYPTAFEQVMTEAEAQPGVNRVKLSLNAALGVALSEKTFLMGRVDGMGDRLADAYDYLQLNLYLYSLGLRYYPRTTGFYLEGGAGATKGVLQSSLYGQTTSPNGFGFGAAAGYDFNAAPRGFGLTLEAKYDNFEFEGESAGCLTLALNLCWK
ncbi:MAG: outer membrane beta-barrel protein [Spirochaetaceae bacterium]|nr:outer membrane beta-barrel protein [Spirochaetaceae bacterium]